MKLEKSSFSNVLSEMTRTSLLTDIPAHLLDYLGSILKSITTNVSLIQNHFHGSKISKHEKRKFLEISISHDFRAYLEMAINADFQSKRGHII